MPWFLYIVRCSDETLYTGITTDIDRRIKEHNNQKGAFYTKNKTPVKLVYQEPVENRSSALKRERAIKSLTRLEKLELISGIQVALPSDPRTSKNRNISAFLKRLKKRPARISENRLAKA
ncbi:MAG: GIY-YIG nuclease family protein [Candidatus Omnitrophica bacterium]|nr:GIY-YIG nuclease family protein [Candidatus Omnitrophota bacterium]